TCSSRPGSSPRRSGYEVLVGLAPRRRRRARDDQRRRADRDGGDARRRGLRDAGGARRGTAGRGGPRAQPVKRGFEWANAADSLGSDVARSSALAVGPGLGRSDEARALVRTLLGTSPLPVV